MLPEHKDENVSMLSEHKDEDVSVLAEHKDERADTSVCSGSIRTKTTARPLAYGRFRIYAL